MSEVCEIHISTLYHIVNTFCNHYAAIVFPSNLLFAKLFFKIMLSKFDIFFRQNVRLWIERPTFLSRYITIPLFTEHNNLYYTYPMYTYTALRCKLYGPHGNVLKNILNIALLTAKAA